MFWLIPTMIFLKQLREKDVAKAFYGLTVESLSEKIQDNYCKEDFNPNSFTN
jgi:hypothetical protein